LFALVRFDEDFGTRIRRDNVRAHLLGVSDSRAGGIRKSWATVGEGHTRDAACATTRLLLPRYGPDEERVVPKSRRGTRVLCVCVCVCVCRSTRQEGSYDAK
jgi:hypothetical protein